MSSKLAGAMGMALSLVLAGVAAAQSTQSVYVSRDWQEPATTLRTRLSFFHEGRGFTNLYVTLLLQGEAALRLGEEEMFLVRGQFMGNDTDRVWVTIDPAMSYHKWPSLSGTIMVTGGTGYATGRLTHGGRIERGAAPTVKAAKVDYTGVESPVSLSFQDFGFAENGSVETHYSFSVHRRGFLGGENLVAKGEWPRAEAETQGVTVVQGGEFTAGADEWFQDGKSYVVRVRVRRVGAAGYASDKFGYAFVGTFTWKSTEAGGVLVPLSGSEAGEPSADEAAFARLHAE